MRHKWKVNISKIGRFSIGFDDFEQGAGLNYFAINFLPKNKENQYWGRKVIYYDGKHESLGLGKFVIVTWGI